MTIAFHPLANLFPLLEGHEFDSLVASIKTKGLNHPITLYQGKILDGRNRYRACIKARVKPRTQNYTGKDPVGFVISENVERRHLSESQRAMVAAKLATLKQGARTDLSPIGEMSQAQAAEMLNVGKRSVERAVIVREKGTPELAEAVEQGQVPVSAAAQMAKKSAREQRAYVAEVRRGVKPAEAQRRTRKAGVEGRVKALPAGTYRVIYADPPWKYNDARQTGDHRQSTGAVDHYSDMTMDEIKALPVSKLAAKDSVLFLWGTFPLLLEALETIKAWGFVYKQAFIWDKGHGSFGHYHDCDAELLLIGTRGSCVPEAGKREKQIQHYRREGHSRKPAEWRDLIDRLYVPVKGKIDRIELFQRGSKLPAHWQAWGAESKK